MRRDICRSIEITELLLTGGDVLTLSDEALGEISGRSGHDEPSRHPHLHADAGGPPARITNALVEMIEGFDSAPST